MRSRAADDLAVALRSQHVQAEHDFGVLRVRLHVERLDGGREARHDQRPVQVGDQRGLLVRSQVVSEGDRETFLLELRDGLTIRGSGERLLDPFELRGVALQALQILPGPIQRPLDEGHDEILGQLDEALELEEGDLGLHHPELGQVPARLGLLGPERGSEAVDLAEGRRRGLEVELPGLGEVRLVAEVIGLEEGRGAFDRRPRQDRASRSGRNPARRRSRRSPAPAPTARAGPRAAARSASRDAAAPSGSRRRAPWG